MFGLTLRLFQIFLKLRFHSTEMHPIERLNLKALKLSGWNLLSNGSTTKARSLVCDWGDQGRVKDRRGKGSTKSCKNSCRMGVVVIFFGLGGWHGSMAVFFFPPYSGILCVWCKILEQHEGWKWHELMSLSFRFMAYHVRIPDPRSKKSWKRIGLHQAQCHEDSRILYYCHLS